MKRGEIGWVDGSEACPFRADMLHGYKKYSIVPNFSFDADYLNELACCHGGIPVRQWFRDRNGRWHRVGRFINYGKTEDYQGPLRPSFLDAGTDARVWWNMETISMIANLSDGLGGFLYPIAYLYAGDHHPDEMDPTHLNMICFDYHRVTRGKAAVVYWDNDKSIDEYYRCEQSGVDPFRNMNHSGMTVPVADSFAEFADTLVQEKPME